MTTDDLIIINNHCGRYISNNNVREICTQLIDIEARCPW